MLYLLGGAARCGKTSFATEVGARRGVGWLSTDTLRGVVNLHMPLYDRFGGIGRPHLDEAEAFFPSFERAVSSCAYLADEYLIEGVGFYPRHVARLDPSFGCRAVFVGQSSVDLGAIARFESRNAWHRYLDDAQLAALPAWIESWSAALADECASFGYPYVDLSTGFEAGLAEAERLLFASSS